MPDILPQPPALSPPPNPMDQIDAIKRKIASGTPLSKEEAVIASKAPMKAMQEPPAEPPVKPVGPLEQLGANVADIAVPILDTAMGAKPRQLVNPGVQAEKDRRQSELNRVLANPMSSPSAGMGNVSIPAKAVVPPPPVTQATPPVATPAPVPVTPRPIPTVGDGVKSKLPPGPVTATLASVSPAAAQATQTPVAPTDVAQSLDAVSKFLASGPDDLTLGNVLDAVGVALSARGGIQRETMLNQRRKLANQMAVQQQLAQLGYNQEQKMAELGYGQEQKMAQINYQNQLALAKNNLDLEIAKANNALANAKSQAEYEANLQLRNELAGKKQDLDNELAKLGYRYLGEEGGLVKRTQNWVSSGGK